MLAYSDQIQTDVLKGFSMDLWRHKRCPQGDNQSLVQKNTILLFWLETLHAKLLCINQNHANMFFFRWKEMPTKRGSFETEADAASTARTARTSRRPKVPVTPSRRTVKPKPRRVEPIPVKPVVKPVNEVDDKPTWNETC